MVQSTTRSVTPRSGNDNDFAGVALRATSAAQREDSNDTEAAPETFAFKIAGGSMPQACRLSATVLNNSSFIRSGIGTTTIDLCSEFAESWLSGTGIEATWALSSPVLTSSQRIMESLRRGSESGEQFGVAAMFGTITLQLQFTSDVAASKKDTKPAPLLLSKPRESATMVARLELDTSNDNESDSEQAGLLNANESNRARNVSGIISGDRADVVLRHGVEDAAETEGLSPEICASCREVVAVDNFLWECAPCSFILCEPCTIMDGGLLTGDLAARVDAALAPECRDSTVMQLLVDECTANNYDHPSAFALRSKLASNVVNKSRHSAGPAPPISPAEARRLAGRGESHFSKRRDRSITSGIAADWHDITTDTPLEPDEEGTPSLADESDPLVSQVTEWRARLAVISAASAFGKVTTPMTSPNGGQAIQMGRRPPPLPLTSGHPGPSRRSKATLDVAFL